MWNCAVVLYILEMRSFNIWHYSRHGFKIFNFIWFYRNFSENTLLWKLQYGIKLTPFCVLSRLNPLYLNYNKKYWNLNVFLGFSTISFFLFCMLSKYKVVGNWSPGGNKWEGIGDYPNPVKDEVAIIIFFIIVSFIKSTSWFPSYES